MKHAETRSTAPNTSKSARPTLLVVDDDPTQRLIISKSAAQCGFDVFAVSNSSDALALAESTSFDLLTLDIMLGEQHGIDLLRQLQQTGFRGQTIIITGTEAAERRSCRAAVNYLGLSLLQSFRKPIDLAALRASLLGFRYRGQGMEEFAPLRIISKKQQKLAFAETSDHV